MRTLIFISLIMLLDPGLLPRSNGDERFRRPQQLYIEDSTHVFWLQYPNPFSPPTIRDSTMGCIYGDYEFYCDIADTVDILLIDANDSVLTACSVASRHRPHYFSAYYCLAGKDITPSRVPKQAVRVSDTSQFAVVLSVHGRKKTVHPLHIYVPKGWYCWIRGM